jgi:hypothetical protein
MEGYQIENVITALIVGLTFVGVAFSPVFRALGHRIMHGRLPAPESTLADPRLDDLADENAMLRRQLNEMEERLGFAERLIAQAKDRPAVGPGPGR